MAAATQAVRVSELVITSQRKAGSRGRFVPRVCCWAMRWPLRRQRRCDDRGSRQLKNLLGRESVTVGLSEDSWLIRTPPRARRRVSSPWRGWRPLVSPVSGLVSCRRLGVWREAVAQFCHPRIQSL